MPAQSHSSFPASNIIGLGFSAFDIGFGTVLLKRLWSSRRTGIGPSLRIEGTRYRVSIGNMAATNSD
jgi:hypothetical protein